MNQRSIKRYYTFCKYQESHEDTSFWAQYSTIALILDILDLYDFCNSVMLSIHAIVIGQNQRKWCGDASNPPGIFLATRVNANPFMDIPILKDWILDISAELYVFLMTNPGNHVASSMHIDIVKDVLDVLNVITRLRDLLNKLIKETGSFVSSAINTTFRDVSSKLTYLEIGAKNLSDAVSHLRFDQIPDILSNMWTNITDFDQLIERLEERLFQFTNKTMNITTTYLKNELDLLKTRVSNVVYKLESQITNALKDFSGAGFRFKAEISLFKLTIGLMNVEMVYSNDALMQCSRFHAVQMLLQGQPALRMLMRASGSKKLGPFLRANIGGGVGFAVALHSQDAIMQLNAYINVLGIKITGDVFISRDGVRFYVEGNIWNVFYAQLDCHAGSTGTDWYGLEISVRGRLVGRARKKRQVQTDATNFESSYLDVLRKVISNIADGAKKRLSQAQDGLTEAQEQLTDAQHWLDEKKYDLRNANSAWDSAVRAFDKAKDALEAAKGPFRRAIEKLNSAQRKVDNLCRIRHCGRVCIPGIKCRICWKKVLFVKVPLPCCHFTSCMISFPNPLCVLANAGCYIVRGIAYAALEVAKVFVRVPMLALDAAKLVVSTAQFVVDKSRVVLKVAEGALEVAKLGLEAVKLGLELAKQALEGLKVIIGAAAKVLDFVVRIGLQSIIDIRNCGFLVKLSTVDIAVFDVSCEFNAFKLGWRKIEVRMNFKNILQSLWNAAKAVIKALMRSIGDIFSGRKRREIESDVTSKMHIFLRNIRSADDPLTATMDILNDTLSVNETEGYSEHSFSDFDNRVMIFKTKCATMRKHLLFLTDTLDTLHNIASQSKASLDMAENVTSDIDNQESATQDANFTAESLGINVDYAHHYNLSRNEIEKALSEKKQTLEQDEHVEQIRNMTSFAKDVANSNMNSLDLTGIANSWMLALENITEIHFNESECINFRDCVLFSISSMYDAYAVGDESNITIVRSILTDLEDSILDIFRNSSFNIYGIHNATSNIKMYLQLIDEMNIYCTEPPRFASSLKNVTTVVGGNATFYCKVESEKEPSFWWYRDEELIRNERDSTLSLQNVTDNTTSYRCEAGNVVANITSGDVYVTFTEENASKTFTFSFIFSFLI